MQGVRPHWILIGTVGAAVIVVVLQGAMQQAAPALTDSLAGRESFDSYCAPCHGTTGTGDGPVAAGLRRKPADLTRLVQRAGGAFPRARVEQTIMGTGRGVPAHGSGGMPVWGPIFHAFESDARVRVRVANLVAYLETIQLPRP